MKTKLSAHLLLTCVLTITALGSARGQIPWAFEPFSRQNKFEAYGVGEYLHQGDTTYPGPNGDIKMKLDDTGLGGFGLAWHFSDFFSVHGDFMFGPATFSATDPALGTYSLGRNGLIQSGRVNVDYNIINRRLTPFVTAGIGYQYFQVEQDYYAGPYFDSGYYYYQDYYSEADFTWNVGGGIRWNVTDNLFFKVTGGAQWLQYQDAHNITTQLEASLAVGWMFP